MCGQSAVSAVAQMGGGGGGGKAKTVPTFNLLLVLKLCYYLGNLKAAAADVPTAFGIRACPTFSPVLSA